MSQEEIVLTMIRGTIAGLPEADQARVRECAEKMRALVKDYAEHGTMALGLVGAEEAVRT